MKKWRPAFFYGWLIVAFSFLSLTTYGVFYAYGVFFKPLMEEFGWSRAATSHPFSLYMIVYTLSALIMGWLADRYGPSLPLGLAAVLIGGGVALSSLANSLWQFYLLYGVVAAFGFGAIFIVPVTATVRWFYARRGLAAGIVTSGGSVGILGIPLLSQYLIHAYGWRTAFLVLGGIYFLVNALAALVIKGHPRDLDLAPYGQTQEAESAAPVRGLSPGQAMGTLYFWTLFIAFIFPVAADRTTAVHVVAYATDRGMGAAAAGALSALGAGGIVGRLAWGLLSDRLGRKPVLILVFITQALGLLALLVAGNLATLYVVVAFLGLAYGGFVALMGPIVGEFFGLKHMNRILGIYFTVGVPAGFLGPSLAGYLYDLTQSYTPAFLLISFSCLISAGLAFLTRSPLREPD